MSQLTFAETEYVVKKCKTRREKFLERMDDLIPWQKLETQLAVTVHSRPSLTDIKPPLLAQVHQLVH